MSAHHLPAIRALFPGLSTGTVMLDNAGGSQLPRCVIDAMRTYMERSYVQLGSDCPLSVRASTVIPRAREVVKVFLGGDEAADGRAGGPTVGAGMGEVFFGSSSTVLCYELAAAYADARDACRSPENAPADLREQPVMVLDPMLATGGSMAYTIELLQNRGAHDITIVCVVCAPEGVAAVERVAPGARLFTATIDDGLNDTAYIVPGLGDAGDRQFGPR